MRRTYCARIISVSAQILSSSGHLRLVLRRDQAAAYSTPPPLAEPLSEREQVALRLLAGGESNREIGRTLYLAIGTGKLRLNHIFHKLDVQSRTQAIVRAAELHLLSLPSSEDLRNPISEAKKPSTELAMRLTDETARDVNDRIASLRLSRYNQRLAWRRISHKGRGKR